MKFSLSREALLSPLQLVVGVVERRQTLPILSNVLLTLDGTRLSLTGTDLEVEIIGSTEVSVAAEAGEVTVSARKFLDICRSLPEGAQVDFSSGDGHEGRHDETWVEVQRLYDPHQGKPPIFSKPVLCIVRSFNYFRNSLRQLAQFTTNSKA